MDYENIIYNLINDLNIGKVYLQKPSSTGMIYPCVIISSPINNVSTANNHTYYKEMEYTLTLVSNEYDYKKIDTLLKLSRIKHITNYTADNLHHSRFSIKI